MADFAQTSTSVIPGSNARRVGATCAETIAAGKILYKTTGGLAGLADANAAGKTVVWGYAEQGGAVNQKINVITRDDNANLGITFAVGDIGVLSGTAGGIAPLADIASGMTVTSLGVAKTTSTFNFNPTTGGEVAA